MTLLTYPSIAQFIYLMVIVALAGVSLIETIVRFGAMRRAMTLEDYALIGGIAAAHFGVVLIGVMVFLLDEDNRLVAMAALGNTLLVAIALLIYAPAMMQHRMALARHDGRLASRLFPMRTWWAAGIMGTAVIIAWSMVWLAGVQALFGFELEAGEGFEKVLDKSISWLVFVPMALMAAFLEEITFRLGLQGLVARLLARRDPGGLVAIVVSSIVWALGHAVNVTPHGWKEVHIFVIGIVLGRLMQTHGLRAAIAAHFGLNALSLLAAGAAALFGVE